MTLELGKIAKILEKGGRETDADLLRFLAKSWTRVGAIPNQLPVEKERVYLLEPAIKEHKANPTSPEIVTNFWQAFWAENGRKVGVSVSVPECPLTLEQLKDKSSIYLPEEFSTQKSRHLLGKMFPEMQSHSVEEGNSVTNEVQNFGWRRFDILVDAPYLGTNESQLKKALVDNKEEEPTLNEYIVAGQASKLLTGRYLDEGATTSRIFGSRRDGSVVDAYFHSGGYLYVYSDLLPGARYPRLGGRGSSGVS